MNNSASNIIYTIGHSTHSLDEFLKMICSFDVKVLVDVRSLPGSRKFPQFNKENLEITLPLHGIKYMHLPKLGGRRTVRKNSINNRWHNNSFRAYADYMATDDFANAINNLESIAEKQIVVVMCAEALWWRCHRSMIADYLKQKGWNVKHIMSIDKYQDHRFTEPAKIIDNKLSYSDLI